MDILLNTTTVRNSTGTYAVMTCNTTQLIDPSSGTTNDTHPYLQLSTNLSKVLSPIIFVIGFVGNISTFIILGRSESRQSTAIFYLRLIAIADNTVLVTGLLIEWIEVVWLLSLTAAHPAVCKIQKFLFYTSTDVAVWLLVAFSIDRFIAVCFPLKKKYICTRKHAWRCCACLLLLGVTMNGHIFGTRTVREGECSHYPKHDVFYYFIRPWMVFIFYAFIPFCTVTVLNTAIFISLWRLSKQHQNMVTSSSTTLKKSANHMTVMCLSVCFSFLVLMFPNMVLFVGKAYWKGTPQYVLATTCSGHLVFVHHSSNFFIYCFTSIKLRKNAGDNVGRRKSYTVNTVS